MSKPSWIDAPEWANYLAQDADGQWYWFEDKPELKRGLALWINRSGVAKKAEVRNVDWRSTLEQRP